MTAIRKGRMNGFTVGKIGSDMCELITQTEKSSPGPSCLLDSLSEKPWTRQSRPRLASLGMEWNGMHALSPTFRCALAARIPQPDRQCLLTMFPLSSCSIHYVISSRFFPFVHKPRAVTYSVVFIPVPVPLCLLAASLLHSRWPFLTLAINPSDLLTYQDPFLSLSTWSLA